MAPKRKKGSDLTADDLENSTSSFGAKEEEFFKIQISEKESFDSIINHGLTKKDKIKYGYSDINEELRDLFLEGFNRDEIRVYKPEMNKQLLKPAQTFLYKLSIVVNNNYSLVEPTHVEDYIHDLMDNVLRGAKFEDGTDLILMPCLLRLYVGENSFAAHADKARGLGRGAPSFSCREGRRGSEIIWVLDEDKHKFDRRYKRGDIQLIANMIAAAQTNLSQLNRAYPARILGIKFDADCLYFYSAYITEEYLRGLEQSEGPDVKLAVNKFPKNRELSLSVYEDRKEIFLYFSAFRKYALGLDAVYVS